jgi:hypothetical protein
MPTEPDFADVVAYARTQDLNDRRIISRVEGFITQGWSSPDASVRERVRATAVAAVAEARRSDAPNRVRTGKAVFG